MPRRSRDLYILNDPYYLLIRHELKKIQSLYRTPPRIIHSLLESAKDELYNCDAQYARQIDKRKKCKADLVDSYNVRALSGGRRRRHRK